METKDRQKIPNLDREKNYLFFTRIMMMMMMKVVYTFKQTFIPYMTQKSACGDHCGPSILIQTLPHHSIHS